MTDAIDRLLAGNAMLLRRDMDGAGVTRAMLDAAMQDGRITRLRKGIYCSEAVSAHGLLDQALACAITGGVIFGASAGKFHGLTDDIPPATTVLVPHDGRSKATAYFMDVRRSRDRRNFTIGVETVVIDGLHIRITSRERTVIDLVRMEESRHAAEAVRCYLTEGGDVTALHRMAETFGAGDLVITMTDAMQAAFERAPVP